MKLLLNTKTLRLTKYPRMDEEPVIGLDPIYIEMDVIQESEPEYDPSIHEIYSIETVDVEAKTVVRSFGVCDVAALDLNEISMNRARSRLAFYHEMLATINSENDLLGFKSAQIQACMTLLMPIKQALEVGIVEGSMYLLSNITPTDEYTAERKAAHLVKFKEFLTSL